MSLLVRLLHSFFKISVIFVLVFYGFSLHVLDDLFFKNSVFFLRTNIPLCVCR